MLRQASAMVLVRDSKHGLEVCMLRRVANARFAAGAYVFPGGVMEQQDSHPDWPEYFVAGTDQQPDLYQHKIAAIRETFEEAGILVTGQLNTAHIDSLHRDKLNQQQTTLQNILSSYQLQLDLAEVIFYDHWITPEGAPVRFDTRFFLSVVTNCQQISHDNAETDASCWSTPAALINLYDRGELKLVPVTHIQLKRLAKFDSVQALIEHAKSQTEIATVSPTLHFDDSGKPHSVSVRLTEGLIEYPIHHL